MDGSLNFVIKQMNKHKVVLIVFKTVKDSLLEVLCGKPFTEKYPQICKGTTKIKCLFIEVSSLHLQRYYSSIANVFQKTLKFFLK